MLITQKTKQKKQHEKFPLQMVIASSIQMNGKQCGLHLK